MNFRSRARRQADRREVRELKASNESLRRELAVLRTEMQQFHDLTRDQMIPALVRANEISAAFVEQLRRERGEDDDG